MLVLMKIFREKQCLLEGNCPKGVFHYLSQTKFSALQWLYDGSLTSDKIGALMGNLSAFRRPDRLMNDYRLALQMIGPQL